MKDIVHKEIQKKIDKPFFLENPKDSKLAHFATPLSFSLAKELKKSPILIAQELASKFESNDYFEKVEALNGYLNFKLSKKFLNELTSKALLDEDNYAKGDSKSEKILLEYVSANPTGPLHIGHARGAIYGDTLARLARYLGYKFDTEYYVNDAGNQIYLLGLSVLLAIKEHFLNENVEYPEQYYKGDYIIDLAKEAFDIFDKSYFIEDNIDKIANWAKDKMLVVIKDNLAKANVFIDSYVSERSYYDKLEDTLKSLKEHNGIYEQDGKIWLASSLKGDEKDRVIVRDNGKGTYLAADIVYHKDKMSRDYDKNINIWGADHHGYIPRMKAAMEFLGFDSSKLEIILAQMVSLLKDGQPYKMSKRAGNFILMDDVLDDIGSDALRYIFLSKKCDTHLEFDINDLKKEDSSNPIFYINYAHARINQVFVKANKKVEDVLYADFESLNEFGVDLVFESLKLSSVLNDAFESRLLQKIPDYLKNLASLFHKFYNENKVIGAQNQDSLLKLFAIVSLSIRTGLKIMGIKAKEKMN